MTQEEHELLNQRDLDQNITGADEQEEEQPAQIAPSGRQALLQHQRGQRQTR